jgi:UDP-N-acetylmuramoyl-tripeptide--D-alanyl-D-alanine ligase
MQGNGERFATFFAGIPKISAASSLRALDSVVRSRIREAGRQALIRMASFYRMRLSGVTFIGVTGSCGKTTTKELLGAILATQYQGQKSSGNLNRPPSLAKTILRVKPWHKFCVLEIAVCTREGRIPLEVSISLARPEIGVVTNIGKEHLSAFGSIEAIAAEKGKLVEALPRHGTAILNVDDPHVSAMQKRCAGRIITYGLSSEAMVRAENIRANWPQRLSFIVHYKGQFHEVSTQLCGAHWVPSVLAALAAGIAMDVPLAKAVQAVSTVPPFEGRMSTTARSDGVTFIVDDAKAPLWSIPTVLQFMKQAEAVRKTIVFGTISDYACKPERAYVSVARQALEVADHVVFVGQRASKCLKAKRGPEDEALQAFYSKEAACDYLREWWRPGDLVLIKGSKNEGTIVEDSLRLPASIGAAAKHVKPTADRPQVVVGLGNPGPQYERTPHNVGYHALDSLARSLGGDWAAHESAMVAQLEREGQRLFLIKLLTKINTGGPALVQLGLRLGFASAECVLIHDDLDLPLGSVRVRMGGGDGGHRGVRSILEAFRTDAIRRVRIGVGRPGQKDQLKSYVLTPFSVSDLPSVDRACEEAVSRVLELLKPPTACTTGPMTSDALAASGL